MESVTDTTGCLDPDTLAAYVDGRLSASDLGAADRHIDQCRSCRGELSAMAAVRTARTATGGTPRQMPEERFGRYVVMRELGRGAMGSVVRAYDPELARAVAVKVLHDMDASAYERLRSEAQAMARLAHPNVVAVYDVAGDRDAMFVAMELIDGDTLRQFARGRPWREVLAACIAAGRGLAAAHAAKLVHRDFKPENVLCGDDGRVAVSDFGLARSVDDTADAHIAGTPAYMAPELYRAEPATPASDQFAFCATTYEMLYGQRAFGGEGLAELRAAILDGRMREPPTGAIPARLWTVLSRGLARDPAQRFPTMTELLDALADDPVARRRRRIAQGAALVGAVAVGAVVVRALGGGAQPSCDVSRGELAGAWDATRRTSVDAALRAARGDVARVDAALDTYADSWVGARRDACEATHVRGTDSQRVLEAREACLDRARRELAALTDLFAHADAKLAARAVEAVFRLRDPASCQLDHEPPFALPQRAELDRARSLYAAGREGDADAIASKVLASLPPGFAPAVVAEALELRARFANTGSPARAEDFLYQALTAAERSGDDRLAADVWIDLLETTGAGARFEASQVAARAVEARFARIDPSAPQRLRYELSLGSSLLTHGSLAPAREHLEKALALTDANHPDVHIDVLSDLCLLESRDQKYERANKQCADALRLSETKFGPEHPRVATVLNAIGGLEEQQHHADAGEKAFTRAAAILEHGGHQDYLDYALAIVNLGMAAAERYDFDKAVPLYERARELFAKDHPKDPNRLLAIQGLADAAQHTGDLDRAIRLFEEARTATEATYAKESAQVMAVVYNLGLAYLDKKQYDEADARFDDVLAAAIRSANPGMEGAALLAKADVANSRKDLRAAVGYLTRAIAASERGPNPLDAGLARVGLGGDQLQLGNPAAAIAPLERAVEQFAPIPELTDETARARYFLGRALWETNRDRKRGRTLVADAQRALAASKTTQTPTGWSVPDLRREIATWVAQHR
jgi:eukaryotic-like serine/threonine-protein kinase